MTMSLPVATTPRKETAMTTDTAIRRLALQLLTAGVLTAMPAAAALRFQAAETAAGEAVLEIQANHLVTMTPLPFRLLINDPSGQPLAGAHVECALIMPSMRMPENRPKVTERDGAYGGEMILTCAMGDYRAVCVVEAAGGGHRALTFDIGRARLK
jgi:hypothetical protein